MPDPNKTPWDIYVDEQKVPGDSCLGLLEVPNTASFSQKLFRCRQRCGPGSGQVATGEVHWSSLHGRLVRLSLAWIDVVFQHRGAKFRCVSWDRRDTKEAVLIEQLGKFSKRKKLSPPYNIVLLLDEDSSHAKTNIQNTIRETARITRCYHIASHGHDCVQCCDMLLGAVSYLRRNPDIPLHFPEVQAKAVNGERLSHIEIRRYLSGYLAMKMETDGTSVYDLTKK